MKVAYYIKKESLCPDAGVRSLLDSLAREGFGHYRIKTAGDLQEGTGLILSLGGDGTFLSASTLALQCSLPILGVNFGRIGFLSDASPEDLPRILRERDFRIEDRTLLHIKAEDGSVLPDTMPMALNEISVSRIGASMLGIDVRVDGTDLPTYWADGLLVATGTGSTAYNLSVGGPICTPDTDAFIISPISPHNLNLRPLIVPTSARISIGLRSREDYAVLNLDNRGHTIPAGFRFTVALAPVPLRRICVRDSGFFNALHSRLHWGEDLRNESEQ